MAYLEIIKSLNADDELVYDCQAHTDEDADDIWEAEGIAEKLAADDHPWDVSHLRRLEWTDDQVQAFNKSAQVWYEVMMKAINEAEA